MKPFSLRKQLLFSHLALVGLMAIVMAGAALSFLKLGRSIDRILKDNYKSVIAAQNMKETLERQDSATTFFLAGQTERARKQWQENWPLFEQAHAIEAGNITESGEKELSDEIERRFMAYKNGTQKLLFANPPLASVAARQYYFGTLEPQFRGLKTLAQKVLDLNQAAIVRADLRAKNDARRASVIALLVTIGALALAIIFAHGAINASLTPLLALAQGAEEIGAGHLNRRIELHRSDEIGTLAAAFNGMAEKLREARKVEQQRLHRAQRMSDAALENLYDPVLVTDATGTVVHLNRAAEALFGPAAGAAGLPAAQVVREERIAQAVERAVRQQATSAEEGEAAFVTLDVSGAPRAYRLRATPMRDDDGALLGAALVLEDVTHLRELDRLKNEFIGVASHELRTPVTSLLLSAQLLQEGAAGPLNEDQQEIVAAQREDLQRLETLMRDLLDITRLESGTAPPRLELVRPAELISAAQSAVAAQAAAKGVKLETRVADDLPVVHADRAQIARVLVNLLSNAVRHTPAGGQIVLEAQNATAQNATAQKSPEGVRFAVCDTGNGIPNEFLPRIFDRFVQVPGATRGGAGLGLSIAQTIVRAHGGEITAHSEVGQGSRFEFELKTEQ